MCRPIGTCGRCCGRSSTAATLCSASTTHGRLPHDGEWMASSAAACRSSMVDREGMPSGSMARTALVRRLSCRSGNVRFLRGARGALWSTSPITTPSSPKGKIARSHRSQRSSESGSEIEARHFILAGMVAGSRFEPTVARFPSPPAFPERRSASTRRPSAGSAPPAGFMPYIFAHRRDVGVRARCRAIFHPSFRRSSQWGAVGRSGNPEFHRSLPASGTPSVLQSRRLPR